MEASGASTAGDSQPPPEPMSETPAPGPCAADLAAVGEDEGVSSICERVVSGLKSLSKERDTQVKLANALKSLKRQREGLHSSKRSTMDVEIRLAKQRWEKQAALVKSLEGRDGPFKEKFLNERRFGKMKVEMEEDENPVPDQLPPQCEATSSTLSQDSRGGMLQVIKMVESPIQMERMVFSGDDIPDSMPDKVKNRKPHTIEKTVFVPFDINTENVQSFADQPLPCNTLKNDSVAGGLQIPAEPISQVCAGSQAVAACSAPGEPSSILQQQEASGTAPSEEKDTVDMGDADNVNVSNKSSAIIVSDPTSSASGPVSVWGAGKGAPTFAQVVSSPPGSVIGPGRRVPGGAAQATTRQPIPAQATTSAAPGPFSVPFPSAGGQRRNVVMLKWEGGSVSPARRRVVDLILAMGFGAADLYALIHVDGTGDYTISFTRPEGLDLFWERYEARCKSSPEWEGLVPVAISVQSTVKKITIILTNESIPAKDLEVWLRHYGELLSRPTKILDDRNIWTGGWSITMRLAKDGNVVRHLPSSAFIGRDRMTIFYPGQPKLCHRCGEKGHFSSGCPVLICTMCRGRGHVAKECSKIRCNLCQHLGHPYSQCPDAWHNIEKDVRKEFLLMDKIEAFYNRPSSSVADPPGPVQVPSPAPAAIPSESVSPPSVSVPVSPQPSVSAVSVPSVSQESVSPLVSSPPKSVPSNVLEDPTSLQEEVRLGRVVEGAKEGATASSEGRPPGKALAKTKNREVILSDDDVQYLERRKGVRRKKKPKAQVVQVAEDPVPISNRFSVLSGTSASEVPSEGGDDSEMDCEGASRKREASGDEQQRGAKKPSI